MNVAVKRVIPFAEAFAHLREAPLDAADRPIHIYRNARIRLVEFFPDELNLSSLYLLREKLDLQKRLKRFLLGNFGIDTYNLPGILVLETETGIEIMAPPFVEIYEETVSLISKKNDNSPPVSTVLKIPILKDGFHRAALAKDEGLPIKCVLVSGASGEYLPYAYPNHWNEAGIFDKVPGVKKHYRRQDPYTFMRPLRALKKMGNEATPTEWGRK